MATTEDEIIIDLSEGFSVGDECEAMPVLNIYEAYANVVGQLSANAELLELSIKEAINVADSNALLDASINLRLCLAEMQGAMIMMDCLGLNPKIQVDMEVEENAKG